LKLKDLLIKLSDLEATLHKFSFERLTAAEARDLKETLEEFREQLQNSVQRQGGENSNEASSTVHSIDKENDNSEVDLETPDMQSEISANVFQSSNRFTAYLKESTLSEKQLGYINGILAAAEIATRITNDPITLTKTESFNTTESSREDKNLKTNAMSSADKSTSEKKKSSKFEKQKSITLDLNPILEDCLGKKDLLKELIKLYKQNALEFIGQLKIHLQNLDFEAIRFASHKIKSGLRMMNTHDLLVIAEQIELGSKTDQDIKHLNFLFDCFVKEYPLIEKAIDEEFEKLN